jgi:hypothetical protein
MDTTDSLLRAAWKARNDLYLDLFGPHAYSLPKGNELPSPPEPSFQQDMNPTAKEGEAMLTFKSDMASQRIPILAYAPNEQRDYWMYVTNGLSNPWFQEEPGEVSGFGCELIVKSQKDGRWPARLLRRLSYYILSYTGTLSPGVILSMKTPLAKQAEATVNNLFVWYADEAPDCVYQLPSGAFGLFCTVGITEDECVFAESIQEYGCWSIQQVLRQTGVGQLTYPHRGTVMKSENIGGILESVRSYADNFRMLQ